MSMPRVVLPSSMGTATRHVSPLRVVRDWLRARDSLARAVASLSVRFGPSLAPCARVSGRFPG